MARTRITAKRTNWDNIPAHVVNTWPAEARARYAQWRNEKLRKEEEEKKAREEKVTENI